MHNSYNLRSFPPLSVSLQGKVFNSMMTLLGQDDLAPNRLTMYDTISRSEEAGTFT